MFIKILIKFFFFQKRKIKYHKADKIRPLNKKI